MKHLFATTVLLLAVCGRALGDPASDERAPYPLIPRNPQNEILPD